MFLSNNYVKLKKKNRNKRKILNNSNFNRYRFCYNSSNKYINIQIVDIIGDVIISLSTCSIKKSLKNNKNSAFNIGKEIGNILINKGIQNLFLDKGRLKYHGKIKTCFKSVKKIGIYF